MSKEILTKKDYKKINRLWELLQNKIKRYHELRSRKLKNLKEEK